jgi:hypothetical protein
MRAASSSERGTVCFQPNRWPATRRYNPKIVADDRESPSASADSWVRAVGSSRAIRAYDGAIGDRDRPTRPASVEMECALGVYHTVLIDPL